MDPLLDQRSRPPQSMLPDPKAPDMPFHPLAQLFPLPSEDELRGMADDIAARGLREPIVTLEGQILDGRCRYLACKMAAVEPPFEGYDGDDPVAYVLSRNVHRRHLNESQRALVAARIANLRIGANQYKQGMSIGRASSMLNVGTRSVARARFVVDKGTRELLEAVESGKTSVSAAFETCRRTSQLQQDATGPGEGGGAQLTDANPRSIASADVIGATEPGSSRDRAPSTPTNWLWPNIIPLSAVTIIAGGAAALPFAVRIAATVARRESWPDLTPASFGKIFWLSGTSEFIEKLRPQISAPGRNFALQLVQPETDTFGLPIRHFAWDLGRLRSKLVGDVNLVVLDSFLHHIVSDAFDETLGEFCRAIKPLSELAVDQGVAVVLPCHLPLRERNVVSRAVSAFAAIPEVATILHVDHSRMMIMKTHGENREFKFNIDYSSSPPMLRWECSPKQYDSEAY